MNHNSFGFVNGKIQPNSGIIICSGAKMNNQPVIALILYKPCPATFARVIAAVDEGYLVYLFDNSADCSITDFIENYPNALRYFTLGRNVGIALALRMMCATAYYEGYNKLLYFDQDSVFTVKTLDFISEYADESLNKKHGSAVSDILSVTFRDKAVKRKSSQIIDKIIIGKYELNIVDLTISSGTLFSLSNLKMLGWHNDKYYIDGVDYYICLAAEEYGMKIAEVFDTPNFDHESEQTNMYYKLLTITYRGRKYPVYRIEDTIISYLKLIIKAASIKSRTVYKLIAFLAIYLIKQISIRFSVETSNNEER